MAPRIKQEDIGSSFPSNIPALNSDNQSETPSDAVLRTRRVRSAAPSIVTQPHLRAAEAQEVEDPEPVMLEVRRVSPKFEPDSQLTMAHQSFVTSFSGSTLTLRGIGAKLKDINDALGELQARGIQHVISLPELVLVGDQSSGKSSLMSAIADLRLPRSSGTCTRCPIHIRVSRAEEWSCSVFLKIDYAYKPPNHPITERDVTPTNKFPPWVLLEPNRRVRHDFKVIRDQFDTEEIETVLRCAQTAILNPTHPYQMFVPKSKDDPQQRERHFQTILAKEEKPEAQFSPNTVALEVKGPDLPDLNFYDLPGVFMTARRAEDAFLERVVQNLAEEYIKRESALILCAVPMNQDAENSLALKIIRKLKAENRCIGVMTKADLLPNDPNSIANCLAMLTNQAHRTGFGYFITSRQGDDLEQQNKMEEAFFNRTADATGHWPEQFEPFKDRCGVEKLTVFLSRELANRFARILPEVQEKVNLRLQAINAQLSMYPDPPRNPELEIIKSLAEFTINVKNKVLQEFMNLWDVECADKFRQNILLRKPIFNVRDVMPQRSRPEVIEIDSDSPVTTPSSNRKRTAPATADQRQGASNKRQRVPQNGATVKPETGNLPATPRHPRLDAPATTPSRPKPKSLMDIRALIKKFAVPGQPGLVSASVYKPLFEEAAESWEPFVREFVDKTLFILKHRMLVTLDGALSHLKNRVIYKESLALMHQFIESHRERLLEKVKGIYELEKQRLFTKDVETLERHRANEKKILVWHRNHVRVAAHAGEELGRIPKMEELNEEKLKEETRKLEQGLKNLGPDPFEQEIEVAAYVRGYYLTAAHRFVDYVCIHVMSGLLPTVSEEIDTYLHEKLGLTDRANNQQVLARLMSEGPEIEQKRKDLYAEKEMLDGAMEIIVNLQTREREAQVAAATAAVATSQAGSSSQMTSVSAATTNVGIVTTANGGGYVDEDVESPVTVRSRHHLHRQNRDVVMLDDEDDEVNGYQATIVSGTAIGDA